MALNQIRIIVINGGGSGGSGGGTNIADKNKSPREIQKAKNKKLANCIKAINHPVDAAVDKITGKMSPSAALVTTKAVDLSVAFLKQSFNYHISNVGRSNGDSNYQAQISRKLEIVSDVTNTAGAVLSGAAAGAAVGNVPGAIIGAVAGGISAGMSIGFRESERTRAYQHEMFKQNQSQAYKLSRANYSIWTGRVR